MSSEEGVREGKEEVNIGDKVMARILPWHIPMG
jgi:hypothetical protein